MNNRLNKKKMELNINYNINKSITNMNKLNNNIYIVSKKTLKNISNNEIINEPFKQKKGLKRNTIDKYYTKPCVVKQCIELVKIHINILNNDLIIEPSAGNGTFIENIKLLSTNYKFYDIEPEHNEVYKQDFLEIDYKKLKQKYINIHIIGNPPFGRQASLAIKFIKKCCLFSNSISLILPKSFKWSQLELNPRPLTHKVTILTTRPA